MGKSLFILIIENFQEIIFGETFKISAKEINSGRLMKETRE
jgi:hypothetical protein